MKVKNLKNNEKEISFIKFILQKAQQVDFIIILTCYLLSYIGIRYCYPYPFSFSDSGGYVDAAVKDAFYVYRPFGYSYFLQVLHSVSTNIHFIFIVQLFLLFFATCFFAFTIKYFFTPNRKWVWYLSLSFLIFTPTSFFMANYILSDLFFAVQVYCILSLFIFIIKRKSWIAVILYILILFTALHVRYSAMIFPFILLPFFFMKKGLIRWVIMFLSIFTFSIFYSQIKKSMKEATKIEQFSTGFDGWVYANNVFYTLPHIDLKVEDLETQKLRKLHEFIMKDIDTVKRNIDDNATIHAGFMWNKNLPLKKYLIQTMQEQSLPYLPAFVKLGSGVYKDYAIYIITHYPFSYLRYYYLPNLKQTFYPAEGCLVWQDTVRHKVIYEYYKIDEANTMRAKHDILNPKYPYHSTMRILHLIMWTVIAGIGITAIIKRKKLIFSFDDKVVFWGLFCFAVIYYASSVFAAPMEIRYFISMHSIQFAFIYILLNKIFSSQKQV